MKESERSFSFHGNKAKAGTKKTLIFNGLVFGWYRVWPVQVHKRVSFVKIPSFAIEGRHPQFGFSKTRTVRQKLKPEGLLKPPPHRDFTS
ncbi:MAG: hypothetical protein HC779_02920 [Phyllobacteriaceae bacterium]|nr:hypothetical protein [Phyllobacteriaceae bacterium]